MRQNVLRIAPPSDDELREQQIRAIGEAWMEGDAKWSDLIAAIKNRSPEQIKRMEQERGIA